MFVQNGMDDLPDSVIDSHQTFVVPLNCRFKAGFIHPAAVVLQVNSNCVTHQCRSCLPNMQSIV